jgi:nucleoside-diphosphate-sugar epimerase
MPDTIRDVDHLEELLSVPTEGALRALSRLDGDLMFLGVGGKMGPTMARMARRAFDLLGKKQRVIGVARFSSERAEATLRQHGVETIRCDLLDEGKLQKLPEAPYIVYMVGMKFGASGQAALTWAMNCLLPGLVCRKFRGSRIVAFSTGNVYGMVPVAHGGSREADALTPQGEYALSALGRERVLEYCSQAYGTPLAILRLNYACEMRYGVLVDIAQKVWRGEPVDVGMPQLNAIWQGDANAMSLQAFDHVAAPPFVVNIAGPEALSVRRLAEQFGGLLQQTPAFAGTEAADAYLSNAQLSHRLFGYPRVSVERMVHWIADWVKRGGETLGRPTKFQVRDGRF